MINYVREEQPPLNLIRPPQLEGFKGPRIAESIINQQPGTTEGGIQNTRQYWNEKEQNWLRLSVNLNPLAFANYEPFKSANIDISESPNPVQCVLCFIFKFIILILYFFTPYYQTMKLYETIIILGAADFWIIKNISGRYQNRQIRKIIILIENMQYQFNLSTLIYFTYICYKFIYVFFFEHYILQELQSGQNGGLKQTILEMRVGFLRLQLKRQEKFKGFIAEYFGLFSYLCF